MKTSKIPTHVFRQDPAGILERVTIHGEAVEVVSFTESFDRRGESKAVAVILPIDDYLRLCEVRETAVYAGKLASEAR